MSSVALAGCQFTAGGMETMSAPTQAGHDKFIGALADFPSK
jgi:hypothetical protein